MVQGRLPRRIGAPDSGLFQIAVDAPPRRTHRMPAPPMALVLLVVALPILLFADSWCLRATRLPVLLYISPTLVIVTADGQSLTAALGATPDGLLFVPASAAVREYQVDGTDSTNNFTEDIADLATLLPSPEYQFEAWMRGNGSYSTWVDVGIEAQGGRSGTRQVAAPTITEPVALPHGQPVTVTVALERPEAPASIEVRSGDKILATFSLDRNDRVLQLAGATTTPVSAYFPELPGPFAAEVVDTLLRIAIWAWVVMALALGLRPLCEGIARLARVIGVSDAVIELSGRMVQWRAAQTVHGLRNRPDSTLPAWLKRAGHALHPRWQTALQRSAWPDRAAAVAVAASFGFTVYIAIAQYHAEPHVLDASAYYFQAKIFASGRLAAPVPADLPAFQGPFMVAWQGRWFAQYPPATSALLALGLLAGMPWMVEPLLGAAALAGIYLLGRRLFGGPTALLAIVLGAVSPFYSFLAASYLSHTVALCFEVYFLVFAIRFTEGYRQRDIVAAGACLGIMFCTREFSAVICGVTTTAWLVGWYGRRFWRDRQIVIPAALAGLTALGVGLAIYLAYNVALTGNAVVLPRNLFSPADQYGFGIGIGFYGQHTLAAGLVILDQLLTSLLIDLYGWPFYLTLAFVPIALLRRHRPKRWDWFLVTLASLLTLAQVGYFYHGIFLGPRYLFETLPCLLLLTARGITALPELVSILGIRFDVWWQRVRAQRAPPANVASSAVAARMRGGAWAAATLIVAALVTFNLVFYLPRQLAQHQNFTGLSPSVPVDVSAIYRDPPRNAVVVTSSSMIYNYVLWPLNDPLLRGSTLYAFAPEPGDIARLAREFPDRSVYILVLGTQGQVSYLPVASKDPMTLDQRQRGPLIYMDERTK